MISLCDIRVASSPFAGEATPYVWFTRDSNGDGRADSRTLVSDDYGRRGENPEYAPNSLMRGIDNWFYSARYDGRFTMRDKHWIRQRSLEHGQWGITMDDFGRIYTNLSFQHLQAGVVPAHYYQRNEGWPYHEAADDRIAFDETVWPSSPSRKQTRMSPRFIAACGPVIYRGDRFPSEFSGNAFIAEPAANLVRRSVVTENLDGSLSARNAYNEKEFLTSTDSRFRPVNLYNAPDGTLYIVDMNLDHGAFANTHVRNLLRHAELDHGPATGRIYRIRHESTELGPVPRLSQASPMELVTLLAHSGGWWRDTAQRLLVEREATEIIPALVEIVSSTETDIPRIHALWTLEGLGFFSGASNDS